MKKNTAASKTTSSPKKQVDIGDMMRSLGATPVSHSSKTGSQDGSRKSTSAHTGRVTRSRKGAQKQEMKFPPKPRGKSGDLKASPSRTINKQVRQQIPGGVQATFGKSQQLAASQQAGKARCHGMGDTDHATTSAEKELVLGLAKTTGASNSELHCKLCKSSDFIKDEHSHLKTHSDVLLSKEDKTKVIVRCTKTRLTTCLRCSLPFKGK